jgi:hypothetical protein
LTTLKITAIGLLILTIIPACSYGATFTPLRIVENAKPRAVIIIAPDASEQLRSAAKTLQTYVQKTSQAKLPIEQSNKISSNNKRIHIWIGPSNHSQKLQPVLQEMDGDGFIISFPTSKDILIVGPTDWGTEFGIYEFLEKFLGIRWLMPGPDGEHVPVKTTIEIPAQEIKQEPAFFSRQLSGFRGSQQIQWARRNRMHGRVKFHHNLINIFPPEKYTKTHPEFYPIHNDASASQGKRYLPKTNKDYMWQPCFSAPGIVDEAVKNICNYFEKNQKETYFSLGVNDGAWHCECDKCRSKDNGKKNYIGWEDLSDRYFEWANAVVEGVLETYPDKWFGCLASSEIAAPPKKVKVHPRIIPYMTYDRMKWVDKDIELKGFEITRQWAQSVSTLGWYDYIYGTPYMLPRVYFHKNSDYYQYAAAHGVKAMYAEAYPNWGEGPKLYIALKLMWDPEQDVSSLLNDWYMMAVGKKAAPYLAQYYRHWENFWTIRIPKSHWFSNLGGQFLAFNSPEYLDWTTFDDMEKSRRLLESAAINAKTDKEKRRANYLLQAFEYYEASALSYLGVKRGKRQSGKDLDDYIKLNNRRYQLVKAFQKDPVLSHPLRFDERYEYLSWNP